MLDYILYAEFDINEGSIIKLEYPQKTGVSELVLASYMIPEGAHNIMNDCFCFIVNRKENYEEIIIENIKRQMDKLNLNLIKYLDLTNSVEYRKNIEGKSFKLKEIYNYNSFSVKWESLNLAQTFSKDNNTYLKISPDPKENFYNIIVYDKNTNEVFFSIPIHNDIQFKKLNSNFASIYTFNSQAIGFDLESEAEMNLLEKLFDSNNIEVLTDRGLDKNSMSVFADSEGLINSENEVYFICYSETKLDKSTKRGAILKSVAFGSSKLINLNIFRPVLTSLLEEIFKIHSFNVKEEEKLSLIKKSIEVIYKNINSIPSNLFGLGMKNFEREINCFLQSSLYMTNNEKFYQLDLGNKKVKLDMIIPNNEEKIFPGDVISLIQTFKENTMIIYDALLSDKRILFIGDSNTSCEKLNNFIFSVISMVGPTFIGLLKRIHPYKNLYDMDFLKSPNCIYAVTNPIFKNKTDSWDIMCEIDSGKVTINESYKKYLNTINRETDTFFIKELLYKIKNEFLNEYEVEKYFKIYTYHLMKITGELYFSDEEELTEEINKQYKRKMKLQMSSFWRLHCQYDQIREFINFNGKSLKLVQRHLDNLNSRKSIEKEESILIFSDLEKFLSGGEFYVNLVR